MSENGVPLHFVCTREQAQEIIGAHDDFWVSNCGCREERGKCDRSRIDVCLQFAPETAADGSGLKRISRSDVDAIMKEAAEKNLVTRPYRDYGTRTVTEGICFCCDDCCWYFLYRDEACDKGSLIEKTDMDSCTHCGVCAEVCYFSARCMEEDELVVSRDECYGCGLCADSCPEECVEMVRRG